MDRRALLAAAIIAVSVVVYLQFGYLRTHGGSCMLAPLSGRLEARGAATYITTRAVPGLLNPVSSPPGDTGKGTYAVSWPPGYSAVPAGSGELSVRDASAREVARTGEEVSLTGNWASNLLGDEWQVNACGAEVRR